MSALDWQLLGDIKVTIYVHLIFYFLNKTQEKLKKVVSRVYI